MGWEQAQTIGNNSNLEKSRDKEKRKECLQKEGGGGVVGGNVLSKYRRIERT